MQTQWEGKTSQCRDQIKQFNDKWGLALKQNGWGKGRKKCPKIWFEYEQTYTELMCMTGQKLKLQILQGRTGGATEPVHVEDDRVENENKDDGGGPEKDMGEAGGGGGDKDIELCDGH